MHWPPVAVRIRFKLCLMMYKAMRGLAPAYLSELCASYCVEAGTRSSAHGDLVVQLTCVCRRRSGGKQASKFIGQNNIMTILIQNVNNTMAGYQKEILPSSWSHGTSCHAPFSTVHPWTVSRRLWRHFCSLSIFICTFHLTSLCCCMRCTIRHVCHPWFSYCVMVP